MREKADLRREAVRMRVDERLSLPEIQSLLGVSRSSLSLWLRDYPLSESEIRERRVRNHGGGRQPRPDEPPSKHFAAFQEQSRTRGDKGRIAEAAILFRLTLRGIRVFRSVFEGDTADFLVSHPLGQSHFLKIQVKWATRTGRGMPVLYLRCANGTRRYAAGEFDFLVGYDLFSDTAYLYSASDLAHNSAMVSVSDGYAERWDILVRALQEQPPAPG